SLSANGGSITEGDCSPSRIVSSNSSTVGRPALERRSFQSKIRSLCVASDMARRPLDPAGPLKQCLHPDLLGDVGQNEAGHGTNLRVAARLVELLATGVEVADHEEHVARGFLEVLFGLVEEPSADALALRRGRNGNQAQIWRAAEAALRQD